MKQIKNAAAAIVRAIAPKPSLEELAKDLRSAKAELAEAKQKYPNVDSLYGLPETHMVELAIDHLQKAIVVRDMTLAFEQGDSESDEIYGALADKLIAKAEEARKLQDAVKAAQDALDAFCRGVDADVAGTTEQIRSLNARRQTEDLPRARNMFYDPKFQALLRDVQLVKAAELLREPVPGRPPSEGDLLRCRIREIRRLDTQRETERAVAAKPYWEDRDAWVARWLSADKAGRNEMAEKGSEAKARAYRWW